MSLLVPGLVKGHSRPLKRRSHPRRC